MNTPPTHGRIGLLLLVAFCATAAAQDGAGQPTTARPNILFIFTDDHAPHAIGAYGTRYRELDPTPHIDSLAAQGMLFRNSFCTNSICGPSRAVILTGKHSHRNGFMDNGDRFDGDQVTFPKLLQKGGYQTAMIGKWHLGSQPQGFDYWDVLPGQGDYYNPVLIGRDGRRRVEGYCTDLVTDLAIEWLDAQRDADAPFLLMCQHKAPHRNWMPPLRHLDLYASIQLPEPATLFDRFVDNASPARHQEMEIDRHMNIVYDLFVDPHEGWDSTRGSDKSGFRNLDKMTAAQRQAWDAAFAAENAAFLAARPTGEQLVRWKYQRYMKNYLRTIRGVDDSVGRLLAYLKRTGLDQNTVVVYSSDQGFYLGDHGWYDKRWMYEESLKMPLIVRWPGVTAAGTTNRELVQNLDYAQTFLEMAGIESPDDMQGRSLVPLLRGEVLDDWRESIYYHYYAYPSVHQVARHYGLRTERHKLIWFYQFDEWELYDLETDPDEQRNVYGDPANAELIARLKQELEALRAAYGDDTATGPMPMAWRADRWARHRGLTPIFNGVDLTGWRAPKHPECWVVEDDVLTVTNNGRQQGDILYTEQSYRDFVCQLDFRFGDGTVDSGVFLRNDREQIQLGISGSLKRDLTASPYIAGKGYPVEATGVAKLLRPDDWNTLRIRAFGKSYTTWLNGREVMNYTSPSAIAEGPLGLQLHAGREMTIQFRNIAVTELTSKG